MIDKTEIFVCNCSSIEHQITINCEEEDGYKEVLCCIHLVKLPFWERLWNGIKYIFGHKCKYGNFEEFIFYPGDADRLQKVVDFLRTID